MTLPDCPDFELPDSSADISEGTPERLGASDAVEHVDAELIDPHAVAANTDALPCAPQNVIIALPEDITLGEAIHLLSARIPQNEYGLPVYFYRSDLLAGCLNQLTQEQLDNCSQGLFYQDGYPTTNTGMAFWNKLPHESTQDFAHFSDYLRMAEDYGVRRLDLLSELAGAPLDQIQALYQTYYWSARGRAFDLFNTAAELKRRELRIRRMENTHFARANALFDRLMERFDSGNGDWIEELTAKEAVDVLESLVKIQRLSVGLTGQHASSNNGSQPQGASVEYILRQITRGAQSDAADNGQSALQQKMLELLSGPEGATIQEAILKVSHSG